MKKKYQKEFYILLKMDFFVRISKLELTKKKKSEVYVEGQCNRNKKNHIDFLSLLSVKDFENSKVGIIKKLLEDINKNLSKYINVSLESLNEDAAYNFKDSKNILENNLLLKDEAICFIDKVNTNYSRSILDKLKNKMREISEVNISCDEEAPYLIRLLREKTYYEKNELEDPYKNKIKGNVQNISLETLENEKAISKALISNIISELKIKSDINEGKIKITNWPYKNKVSFIFIDNYMVNKIDFKILFKMEVDEDACLKFSYYIPEIKDDDSFLKIMDLLKKYDNKDNEIEGIIYDNNPTIILKTNKITIPKIDKIFKSLKGSEEQYNSKYISKIMQEENEREPFQLLEHQNLLKQLEAYNYSLKGKDLKKLMNKDSNKINGINVKSKEGRRIRKALEDKGIIISAIKKTKENLEQNYKAILDLRVLEKSEKSFYYFAGIDSIGSTNTISTAANIRKVESLGSLIDIDKFCSLMLVKFVRNNQYTVLPFPFKYLREYALMKEEEILNKLNKLTSFNLIVKN